VAPAADQEVGIKQALAIRLGCARFVVRRPGAVLARWRGGQEEYMRKPVLSAALAAALVVAMGGTAFAGEITGNGKPTPIKGGQAGSICAFSGQNDDPNEPGAGGRVQSFGAIVQGAVRVSDRGASSLVPVIRAEGPGAACRGFASGG
jgi:hypothetical protein